MSAFANRGRAGEGRLKGMILISLFLHGIVLSILFLTPSFPAPKLTFGPVYTVSLVNFSGGIFDPGGGDTAAVRELLGVTGSVTAIRKQLVQEPFNLSRNLGHDSRDDTLEKAMEEIRKRAAAMPKSAEPNTLQEARPLSPLSPIDFKAKMEAYKALIRSRIKGKWTYTQGILPGEQWETSVEMRILRSGVVAEMSIEKKSGNRHFDESVLKAIRKASPFPPLPEWFGENSLDAVIRFHSSELKS